MKQIIIIALIGFAGGIIGSYLYYYPPTYIPEYPNLEAQLEEADKAIQLLDSVVKNQRELIIDMARDCGKEKPPLL